MPALTAEATTKSQCPFAIPAYLLKIVFVGATDTLTLRYSDAPRTLLGEVWSPGVIAWSTIAAAMNVLDTGGTPTSTTVELLNSKPAGSKARLSALLRTPLNTTGTYEFMFAQATIYQVFCELGEDGPGHEVIEAECSISDVTDITPERLTLVLSDLTLANEDRSKLPTVTRDLYASCSSADVGKKIPALFNALQGVPLRCLVGGGFGRLAAPLVAVTADGATATLTEAGDETFPTGRFRIQIDDEVIQVLSRSGTTLRLGRRGASNTPSQRHDADSGVFEIREGSKAYRYGVCVNLGGATGIKNRVGGVTNWKAAHGTLTGVTVDYDEELPVGSGIRLTILNVPGVTKIPSQRAVSTDAGTERFTRTLQSSNGVLVLRANAVIASMPRLVGTEDSKNVNWEVTYEVDASGAGTSYTFTHGTPGVDDLGFGARINPDTRWGLIQRGVYTARFGTGPSYGSLAFRIDIVGTSARLTITITNVVAVVEGTRRKTAGEQGKAPVPAGESTADVLFGGLTADVVGLGDTGAGSITGIPGRLITTPADVVKASLLYCYPGTTLADFGTSFAATRALQTAAGYTWHLALEETRFSELRRKWGEQGQAALTHVGGLWEYTFLATGPSASATIDTAREVLRDSVKIHRTPRADVKNSLRVQAQPDLRLSGAERFRYVKIVEDLTQIRLTERIQADLILDWVQSRPMAAALGAFWLAWWKRSRAQVEITGWWNFLGYDPYDVLALDNEPVIEDWGDTALVFRVTGRRALLGDDNPGRIALSLVEANA